MIGKDLRWCVKSCLEKGKMLRRGIGLTVSLVVTLWVFVLQRLRRLSGNSLCIVCVGRAPIIDNARYILHFCPKDADVVMEGAEAPRLRDLLRGRLIVILDSERLTGVWRGLASLHLGVYNADPVRNPKAVWELAWMARHLDAAVGTLTGFSECVRRTKTAFEAVLGRGKSKAYVFGTGPSLGRADTFDARDGYVVVCNTIVKDPELWAHLKPDVLVAGDVLYHFSNTQYATRFRKDAIARLRSGGCWFIYPARFDSLVKRHMAEVYEWCVPVHFGLGSRIDESLTKGWGLPCNVGNALGMLLLPVGCSLARFVGLWGFDGRAPADKLFWANSDRHSYPEELEVMRKEFPAFYNHHVPANDPLKYVRAVQGDALDHMLTEAESKGYTFEMLHESYTPTLAKRFKGASSAR